MPDQIVYERLREEDRSHFYVYDNSTRVYGGYVVITDNNAPVYTGTYRPAFNLENTTKINYWTGSDWAVVDSTPTMQAEYNALPGKIEAAADAVYNSQIGRRQAEYDAAYSQALMYRDNEYEGDVPDLIQASVDATGQTAQEAADAIIAAVQRWSATVVTVRQKRIKAKKDIAVLGTPLTMPIYNKAMAIYRVFNASMTRIINSYSNS